MKNIFGFLLLFVLVTSCVKLKDISLNDDYSDSMGTEMASSEGANVVKSIYSESISHIYGFDNNSKCERFSHTSEVSNSGSNSLHLKWADNGCSYIGFTAPFLDGSGVDADYLAAKGASIQFAIRSAQFEKIPTPTIKFGFEDSNLGYSYVQINRESHPNGLTDEWETITLPLSGLMKTDGANAEDGAVFSIQFEGVGNVYVDDIKVIK